MSKALRESILFGFILHIFILICGALAAASVFGLDKNANTISYEVLFKSLIFLWFFLAAVIMFTRIRLVKYTPHAYIMRAIFIAGPISLDWAWFIQTGRGSPFIIGMLVSSIFLMYEFVVVPKEKLKNKDWNP